MENGNNNGVKPIEFLISLPSAIDNDIIRPNLNNFCVDVQLSAHLLKAFTNMKPGMCD